jgi:hypothetical protein
MGAVPIVVVPPSSTVPIMTSGSAVITAADAMGCAVATGIAGTLTIMDEPAVAPSGHTHHLHRTGWRVDLKGHPSRPGPLLASAASPLCLHVRSNSVARGVVP